MENVVSKMENNVVANFNMKNVVAYCRVSTNKYDQVNSFEAQQEFFKSYAQEKGLTLVKIYADKGISGTSTRKRVEFNRMMEDSKNGTFDTVLVKDISRLARNTVDFLNSIRTLANRNINVRFITSNMDTIDSVHNELILSIMGALAQEESANMSKRIKFGKAQNAVKGKLPNQCYGYIRQNGDYFHMEINEKEAQVVRNVFDMYVNQGYGTFKISQLLNDQGLTSARGIPWSTTAISRMLKNKIYAGFVINGKSEVTNFIEKTRRKKDESEWIEVERPDLRIIPLALWEKAQNINALNNSGLAMTLHKKRSNKHLFSTLITCPVCGHSFRRFTAKRKDHTKVWWACSGRNHYGADYCKNMTLISEEELIQELDTYFLSVIENKEAFIQEIMKQFENTDTANERDRIESQLKQLKVKRNKQITLFENDVIDLEELKARTKEIDQKINSYQQELNRFTSLDDKEQQTKRLYLMISDNFEKYISVGNMSNADMKSLIRCIVAEPDGKIKITLND